MKKKYSVIDDETLDSMKRYYKLENYQEILQYLRRNNVHKENYDFDDVRH